MISLTRQWGLEDQEPFRSIQINVSHSADKNVLIYLGRIYLLTKKIKATVRSKGPKDET